MEKIIRNSLISYFIIGLYFTGVSVAKHYKDYNKRKTDPQNYDEEELYVDTNYHRCDIHISFRLLMLFVTIFLPVFLITLFGGYCKIRQYKKRLSMNFI